MSGNVQRWSVSERRARVANDFEKPNGGDLYGMMVNVSGMTPASGFTQSHLQEAYELGRRKAL